MSRSSFLAVCIGVVVIAAFMLYRVKYEVQSIKFQIAQTSMEIAQEKELLHVVSAEWAYLNRPERLQALADKYLRGKGVTVEQVAEIEAIPYHTQSVASIDGGVAAIDENTRAILAAYSSNNMHHE